MNKMTKSIPVAHAFGNKRSNENEAALTLALRHAVRRALVRETALPAAVLLASLAVRPIW